MADQPIEGTGVPLSGTTVDAEVLLALDAALWAEARKVKLQKGTWSFKDRPYLVEPMQARLLDAPNKRCFMKGTQGGYTEMQVLETLWGLIHGYYSRGVLYLFPTTDDVSEFSKARFGPLIRANPSAIGKYIASTDTSTLKRVGDSFLYLRGGTLSKQLDIGVNESSRLRGISVDKVVFDELDLMDMDAVGKARGRLGDSDVKEEVYISNPTLPDYGISAIFENSDQRRWFRRCDACGEWTCAELQFPNCVRRRKDGTGYICCKKCERELRIGPGAWVPAIRENSETMWGYQWGQLTSPNNDPWEILRDYQDPPEGNLGEVVRLRLGLPFISAEDKLTAGQVLACCGSGLQLDRHDGPCAMGVDVRRHKNVVVGIRSGRDRYQILRVNRVGSFDDVLDMAKRFSVRACVVDIRPYEDEARQFQKKAKKCGIRVHLCEYKESTPQGTQWSDKTGMVTVNRTEILDASHRLISSESQLEIPRVCPEIKQFALECSSIAKVQEINKRTRTHVFRYRKLGTNPDDYRHALGYFYLAASNGRVPVVGQASRRNSGRSTAKVDYDPFKW